MRLADVLRTAIAQLRANLLRSLFTLLGVIVSVAFLVAVVAIIQGMNAFVQENVADAVVGRNAFQVRRTPLQVARYTDDEWRRVQRRPRITAADAAVVIAALPDASAIALTSGYPTPMTDAIWRDRLVADVLIFGITPPYQDVQDYRVARGRPLADVDVRGRRFVAVLGPEVADKLFGGVDPIGRTIRLGGERFEIVGVTAPKGRVLGQSFDAFAFVPFSTFESMFGPRQTTTVSVKMPTPALVPDAMARAEEAMRVAHRLRPGEENDFSVETAGALLDFWATLTRVLFAVVPAVVAIGIVVGGIVIMNIMLMAVTERMHEVGLRKSLGATRADIRRQFLAEAVVLSFAGGVVGVLLGWGFAALVAAVSPLPARLSTWVVLLALGLGAGVGVVFGVYPATRAARLDPIAAMRAET
jgi:putative ABC transport system permease protein